MSPLAVVLPGRAYDVTMPLLALAVDALERHGYDVHPVAWAPERMPADPAAWVTQRLVTATADGCDLVVAKSLGTWASAYVAERAWPAVWLTPVLTDPVCAAGIRTNPAPQLVVAGLADHLHDPEVAAGLGCDVLEIAGANHVLSDTDDVMPRPGIRRQIVAAVDGFLTVLP